MMDIDKLILWKQYHGLGASFSSMMDIDKLILKISIAYEDMRFSSMMDIDELIWFELRRSAIIKN